MATRDSIEVEVAYALPGRQRVVRVLLLDGCSVETAIRSSGILTECPEIDLAQAKVGIHGRRTGLGTEVRAGDRIEIYRPLVADPKAVRRAHAMHLAKPKGVRKKAV